MQNKNNADEIKKKIDKCGIIFEVNRVTHKIRMDACLFLFISVRVYGVACENTIKRMQQKYTRKKKTRRKNTHTAQTRFIDIQSCCVCISSEFVWESNFTCKKIENRNKQMQRKSYNELVLLISKMWTDQLIVRSCRCSSLSINFQFSFASIVPSIDNGPDDKGEHEEESFRFCCLCPFFLLSVIVTKWYNKWNSRKRQHKSVPSSWPK